MPTMLRMAYLAGLFFWAILGGALGKPAAGSPAVAAAKPAVLVTGGAGFIGSHLAKRLQESGHANVVVIDNFNTYYNPALKWQRVQSLLLPAGVRVIEGDVCNDTLISGLMNEYSFKAVYHLAAQAGVRYSLKKPQAYVRENVQCFVALLEQIRAVGESGRPAPKLLYASSSSVYGLSERIPFTETDRVDKLSNLYGATKRMNENTAFAYHNLFNISSIGFRFFTVYGPWGRPDMAAYLFSDNILRGEPITVFNEGKLLRDFTYIDDIVSGLVSALSFEPSAPLVLNLGNNKPVEVLEFITLLESLLGKTANKRFAISRAEMPITFANLTLARHYLGYEPQTTIQTGLAAFVKWYKEYERSVTPCESECTVLPEMCFASGWQAAAEASRAYTKDCNVVVYSLSLGVTSATASSFVPWQVKTSSRPSMQVCAVVFVPPAEGKKKSHSYQRRRLSLQWKAIEVSGLVDSLSKERLARILTLTPGQFFSSSVHHAIYVHPKLELRMHLNKLLDLLHPKADASSSDKVAMLVVRNDQARKDASVVVGRDTSNSLVLQRQVHSYERYASQSSICFQEFFFEEALIVHNLHAPGAKRLRCEWYREFAQWSEHDQVAGAFALARAAIEAGGSALCAQLESSHGHTTEEEVWVPITKAKKGKDKEADADASGVEYVRMLPNKLYHWHFTENLAKEIR